MPSSYAQGADDETGQLLEVIEVQKRRLDEQERQQQQLRRQVEALQRQPPTSPSAHPLELTSAEETELKVLLDREAQEAALNWPGSFDVFGTKTRLKISGFVELDVTHDNHAIASPTAFVTSAIATRDGIPIEGSDGITHFSVQTSRLVVETRTPVGKHQLTTYISMDYFGQFFSANPDPRMRQAYGEVSDILFGGDLLLGQDWSTFTYLPSFPNTLDFEGPPSGVATRRAMLRWTKELRRCLSLKLALEDPVGRAFTNAPILDLVDIFAELDSVPEWPDAVAALAWETDDARIEGALITRDLRFSANDEGTISETAWGANFSGRLNMPWSNRQDFLTFGYALGEGIGGLLNDSPPGAVYDFDTNTLDTITSRGGWLGFQHWWNPDFYSVVTHGQLKVDNYEFQRPEAYRRAKYSSANLVWTPFPKWLFGFEALYGSRVDRDDRRGSVTRFQFTSRLTF